jgi:coproporphyrinogen III oxidase
MEDIKIEDVHASFVASQNNVISQLKSSDPSITEKRDEWTRDEGGGGKTRAFKNGDFLEKGGVNFSDVKGQKLPPSALANRPELTGSAFRAIGVSVVFHPFNPHVPTAHANIRFFSAYDHAGKRKWWFGGGFDLTPYYPILEDVVHWHRKAKLLCDEFNKGYYNDFKDQCDQYFFLPHRNETRGVGGIFFDDLNVGNFEQTLKFVEKVMEVFSNSYFEIFNKRKKTPFSDNEKAFQCYRRGRYAEFNLVYDRGTHFGLQSGGRTESILMSMPPQVNWDYNWEPVTGSKEAELYENFLKPVDWLHIYK